MKTLKILALLAIPLLLISCSFNIDLPVERTGETQTIVINEELGPETELSTVKIEMGGGTLNLDAGTDKLVEGEIIFNVPALEPVVTREGNTVTISQTTRTSISLPQGKLTNNWELKLGSMPLALNISTGAYEGSLNLGGLAITSLFITDGASSSRVSFDEPNQTEMSVLSYSTGASDVELHGLGNAKAREIKFNSGVGSYTLDFSGENDSDYEVSLKSGVSSVKIIIPDNARAEVIINGELSDVDLTGTWTVVNNRYTTGTEGALISITIDMAVGDLELIAD